MNENEGVTDGCAFFAVPFVILVFIGASIFGLIIGKPIMFALSISLGTAFVLVVLMLGIEVFTGIFRFEP